VFVYVMMIHQCTLVVYLTKTLSYNSIPPAVLIKKKASVIEWPGIFTILPY